MVADALSKRFAEADYQVITVLLPEWMKEIAFSYEGDSKL